MQYEEYEKRMRAQKRQPVPREAYRSCVERGYMAVEVDKDEFCKLPDWAMQALCDLDVARDVNIEERDEARRDAATWRKAAEDLEARVKALEDQLHDAAEETASLQAEVKRQDKLIKRFIGRTSLDTLADMLLAGEED
jgi:BMFP domain-containing protein YqiC